MLNFLLKIVNYFLNINFQKKTKPCLWLAHQPVEKIVCLTRFDSTTCDVLSCLFGLLEQRIGKDNVKENGQNICLVSWIFIIGTKIELSLEKSFVEKEQRRKQKKKEQREEKRKKK